MGDTIAGPFDAAEEADILTLGITQRWDQYWVAAVNLGNNRPLLVQLTLDGTTKDYHYLDDLGINTHFRAVSYDSVADSFIALGADWTTYTLGYNYQDNSLYLKDSHDISAHCTKYPSGIAASQDGSGRYWVVELRDTVQLNSIIWEMSGNGTPINSQALDGLNVLSIAQEQATNHLWVAGSFANDEVKYFELSQDLTSTGVGFISPLTGRPAGIHITSDPRNSNGLSMVSHVSQDDGSGQNPVGQFIVLDHNNFITGNETATVSTFNLAIGETASFSYEGGTTYDPNTETGRLFFIVGSPNKGSNPILNELTGESNDTLQVREPFVFGDLNQAVGRLNPDGSYTFQAEILARNFVGVVEPGEPFYIQAFTADFNAAQPEDVFADFSNVWCVIPTLPGTWGNERNLENLPKLPGSRWWVYQFGPNGGVDFMYIFGGGNKAYPRPGEPIVATDEIWHVDMQAREYELVGRLAVPRHSPVKVRIADGRILFAGGMVGPEQGNETHTYITRTCELWNPETGESNIVDNMSTPRSHAFGFRLPDDRVVVAGGVTGPPNRSSVPNLSEMMLYNTASTEIYDPVTNQWQSAQDLLYPVAGSHTASVGQGTGIRIVYGGYSDGEITNRVFSFNIHTLNLIEWTPMLTKRAFFGRGKATAATRLLAGGVADLGGPRPEVTANCELYDVTGTTDIGGGNFTYGSTVEADPLPDPMAFMATAQLIKPGDNGYYEIHFMGGIGFIRGSGGKHYSFNAGSTAGNQFSSEQGAGSDHSGGGVITSDDGTITVLGGDTSGVGENTDQSYTPNQ